MRAQPLRGLDLKQIDHNSSDLCHLAVADVSELDTGAQIFLAVADYARQLQGASFDREQDLNVRVGTRMKRCAQLHAATMQAQVNQRCFRRFSLGIDTDLSWPRTLQTPVRSARDCLDLAACLCPLGLGISQHGLSRLGRCRDKGQQLRMIERTRLFRKAPLVGMNCRIAGNSSFITFVADCRANPILAGGNMAQSRKSSSAK